MRYFPLLLVLLVTFNIGSGAQNTVKMSAVKSNDYGVTYSLPKTVILLTVEYTKTTRKTGEFYQYAERYLSISNPITQDEVVCKLDKLEASTDGVPDRGNSYLVEFKPNSLAPFVTLTKDGLIAAINSDVILPPSQRINEQLTKVSEDLPNPRSYFSEEILRAGSSAKQAELIAKQIYQLRESRNEILTGQADNMPPDGDAYKLVLQRIDQQEKALTGLFIGTETEEKGIKQFVIQPDEKNIARQVVFRFSSKLGVVGADDLAGAPVYLSLTNKEPKPEVFLTDKEQKDLDKKFSQGVVYNIPAKATLQVEFNGNVIANKECDVVQYGTQEVLAKQMFDNNKQPIKVLFFPDLGAIRQIIQ